MEGEVTATEDSSIYSHSPTKAWATSTSPILWERSVRVFLSISNA